jgi:hypothetical protein
MKTLQGFDSISVSAEEDGVMLHQGDDLIHIPSHLIKAVIKTIRDADSKADVE